METILALSLAMAIALILNRVVKKIGLPNVTGYLIAGLIVGPYVLNIFPENSDELLTTLTNIALAFIAFSIGGEFKFSDIKSIGKSVLIITLFQSLTALALVDIVLIIFGFDTPLAITLGAIATATAPAATLMVVRQYRAHGPVTNILLPVVALDDAVGLVAFSISLSLAQGLTGGSVTAKTMLLKPLIEIVGSLGIGCVAGLIITLCVRFFHSRANRSCVLVAAMFLCASISEMLGLSSLLLCMAAGAVLANLSPEANKMLDVNERWTPPLYMLFFVISGAELDISLLPSAGLLGASYIIARSLGKYFGAYVGSMISHTEKNIRKYLGITLLPQAGVAIGMSMLVVSSLPEYGKEIRAVVLCATLIYELVGPLLTKIALTRAGEIEKVK